jgi:hypothetical protein
VSQVGRIVVLVSVAMCVAPSVALADNCGSLSDCYNTLRAALAAAVGVGVLGALASLGLDLLPGVGTIKGVIEAITGRDLVTGQELAWWERALGIIPVAGGLIGAGVSAARTADRIGDAADVARGIDRAADAARAVDRAGDLGGAVRTADRAADAARAADRASDAAVTGRGGAHVPGAGGARYIDEASPETLRAYERIAETAGDVPSIARNTGVPRDVLDRVKEHVFRTEHRVPVGPNDVRAGRFTPDDEIADLWTKAERGTLRPGEAQQFRRLAAHEYVESRLMEAGLPYRSADPGAWVDGVNFPTRQHFGAHDLAPMVDAAAPPFRQWEALGRSPEGLSLADDLSNLDDIVAQTLARFGG